MSEVTCLSLQFSEILEFMASDPSDIVDEAFEAVTQGKPTAEY